MTHIKIILGSNRPGRFVSQPGEWLLGLGKQIKGATFEIVDLAEIDLPFLNEPLPALMSDQYQHEHTQKWSKIVGAADGFVFVTPEYNHGYAPVLKNALDYLYSEWAHKPAAFLSYGADAGGARAAAGLSQVAGKLGMYDIAEDVVIADYYTGLNQDGAFVFTDQHKRKALAMLEQIVFWGEVMREARAKLTK